MVLGEEPVGPRADANLGVPVGSLALLVEGHDDRGGAVAADQAGAAEKLRLAVLEGDRIDDALALEALQARLENAPLGGIDHHGDAGDLGLGGDKPQEPAHGRLAVDQRLVDVDVDQVCAVFDLLARNRDGCVPIAGLDRPGKPGRARDIGALADDEKGCGGFLHPTRKGSRPLSRSAGSGTGGWRGGRPSNSPCDRGDMVRGRSAAAADEIDPAVHGKIAEDRSHVGRRFIVAAEGIGEARVRIAGHIAGGHPGELLDIRPHGPPAQGAVDADAERLHVGDA